MSFTPKQWKNSPDTSTPIDAAALVDLETRVTGYIDSRSYGRVLLWDADAENYVPTEFRADTSLPREFVGPTNPATIGTVTGPVFGDRWTPTEAP